MRESFVVRKFKEGEVHVRAYDNIEFVCGWYFESTKEFRPLASDAMAELREVGFVTENMVANTADAYQIHTEKTLKEYAESQERFWTEPEFEDARREQMAEMRAAFGPGEEVVNVFTGRKTIL